MGLVGSVYSFVSGTGFHWGWGSWPPLVRVLFGVSRMGLKEMAMGLLVVGFVIA